MKDKISIGIYPRSI